MITTRRCSLENNELIYLMPTTSLFAVLLCISQRDRVVSTLADSDSGAHEPTPIIMLRNLMPTVIEDDV